MRKWFFITLIAACAAVFVGTHVSATQIQPNEPEQDRIRPIAITGDAPLTIAMSNVGNFSRGHSWHLSVNSAGQAQLTIETVREPTLRQFAVSVEQMQALRAALINERFFDLADTYGESVPCGSTDTITITAGAVTKSVKLLFLMNWVESDPAKLRDPARAIRVGMVLRNWFDDAKAVDLRPYDQKVLDAVK